MSRLITAFLLMFSIVMAFSSNASTDQLGQHASSCPIMADDADEDKKEGEAEEEEPDCD